MKKYLSMLAVAVICCCLSCNNKNESGVSAVTQKNLDAMHAISHSFETKDFSKLGDYIAADAVDHAGEKGDVKGLDSMKAEFIKEEALMNDEKTETIKELADDQYVMSWMHYTAVMKIDGMGHRAGDTVDMKSLEVAKFVDGKAVEHWTFMEPGDVVKMMGAMGQSPMSMPADSTKMKK
jgi:SnoaL-like polyketide cyclase